MLEVIQRISDALDRESQNPCKTTWKNSDSSFSSVLPGWFDGYSGAKVITWDEASGDSTAIVTLMKDGQIHYSDYKHLTAVRCALVVAATVRKLFEDGATIRYGIVGYGKIGRTVDAVMRYLYNGSRVIIRSPRADPRRNVNDLSDCDVVITATSTREGDQPFEFNSLWNAKAYISLDGGFMLGKTFRELRSYTDHTKQISNAFREEFPYDEWCPTFGQFRAIWPRDEPVGIYLHGVGSCDIITALALAEGELVYMEDEMRMVEHGGSSGLS